MSSEKVTRRGFLKLSAVGAAGVSGGAALLQRERGLASDVPTAPQGNGDPYDSHFGLGGVGDVDLTDFDPSAYLTDFDYGQVSTLENGQTLREYTIVSVDKEIEVAPGIYFPAWTYHGQVPGPTLRATEGDRIRIHFTNAGSHPHTLHFHGIHAVNMDGVWEVIENGQSYTYEFDAEPFGLHLYHCHTTPLKTHIHKGLYGVFIVDPPAPRPPAKELVMMMNGFDTNFDGDNEIYAVNTVGFHFMRHPIPIKKDELVRIYLVNITEFDPINSIHIHANFFDIYPTGTRLEPDGFTDTAMFCQGERAILEFRYKFPGNFIFHAHQSEFSELGWFGTFEVTE